MLVSPQYAERSIAEITEAADVGLGSFYNHFARKPELFDAAVAEVLEEHGALIDAATADVSDPAEAFAVGVRYTGRLVITHPQIAQILATKGMSLLDATTGLAPRLRRLLVAGQKSGRFADIRPEVAAVSVGGSLLGLLHLWLGAPELVDESWCDEMVERLLVMLGLDAADAAKLARAPLP